MMATENAQEALKGHSTGRNVSSNTLEDLEGGEAYVLLIVYSLGGGNPCSLASLFLEHSGRRTEIVAGRWVKASEWTDSLIEFQWEL